MFTRGRGFRSLPGLEWGIRESLTSYVAGLPDGVVAASGSARIVPGTHPPRFFFPEAASSDDRLQFIGVVEIVGHRGMLRVFARDPWLTLGSRVSELSIVPDDHADRITLAEIVGLERDDPAPRPAWLTEAGAHWLGPRYTSGDEASAVSLRSARRRGGMPKVLRP